MYFFLEFVKPFAVKFYRVMLTKYNQQLRFNSFINVIYSYIFFDSDSATQHVYGRAKGQLNLEI